MSGLEFVGGLFALIFVSAIFLLLLIVVMVKIIDWFL